VELFDWSAAGGSASLKRREGTAISTLGPGEPRAGSTACEILVSPNGRYVYTCTRGTDSLQVFRIDARTGALTGQQRLPCGGRVPRHIAFDASHRWLLVANQVGSSVTVFSNDPRTGRLSGPVQTLAADTPMFVQFI
jgi:6-phosphogluconolactonase